jgi:hypothetical protein
MGVNVAVLLQLLLVIQTRPFDKNVEATIFLAVSPI